MEIYSKLNQVRRDKTTYTVTWTKQDRCRRLDLLLVDGI